MKEIKIDSFYSQKVEYAQMNFSVMNFKKF